MAGSPDSVKPSAEDLADAYSDTYPDRACTAEAEDWLCTRSAGHQGPHVAGGSAVRDRPDYWWFDGR